MPKRKDIKKILIIGSGPIIIGQACEFDYSGAQACKALRAEGYETILVNSNPATIMTDPEMADRTYIEPLSKEYLESIIAKERPDALLPTVGGQTALNLAVELSESGVLEKYKVEMIGASLRAIKVAEDRLWFKDACRKIGLEVPASALVNNIKDALRLCDQLGFPLVIRPSFTLGGTGGSIAYNREEFGEAIAHALDMSPVHEALVEESVLGWKEYELEVMRDFRDNFVVICTIENFDPMGVHTGDSITVAPAQTLTDKEYQRMRDAASAILREVGVETGGSNVQFAVNPENGRMVVIEMNPRVSRSSALATNATGFPIAKIAARQAAGMSLDEIPNDITKKTPASFEPTIDYVVTKIPKWQFEKFPGSDTTLGTQMKSVGEVMAIGRTFKESLQKAIRSLEPHTPWRAPADTPDSMLREKLATPRPDRIHWLLTAVDRGLHAEEICELTKIDPWFIQQCEEINAMNRRAAGVTVETASKDLLREVKRHGTSDEQLAQIWKTTPAAVRLQRARYAVAPVFKRVDTCAAEFESFTPYMYSTYEEEDESDAQSRPKIMILGSGPNRIGQGIEFDYCCCHASFALREDGYETIIVNCNPETVSTDYDTSDRLYFEPLTFEDVLEIVATERRNGILRGVIVQFGGQTPLKLAAALERAQVPILGTSPDAIDLAEDRDRFKQLVDKLGIRQPRSGIATSPAAAHAIAEEIGYPIMIRPSYVLGGRAMEIIHDAAQLGRYVARLAGDLDRPSELAVSDRRPLLIDRYLSDATEVDVDCIADGSKTFIAGIMEHIEEAGIHSGDSACALPPHSLSSATISELERQTRALALALDVIGLMNVQYAIKNGDIYVLEVNPRASRTVPFVAKVIGTPVARIAARVMTGEPLTSFNLKPPAPHHVGVKEAVFPFARFPGVDTVLGPEMRSTGEVMGIDRTFALAFAKSQIGGGARLPRAGTVFVSVRDADKERILVPVKLLAQLGFKVVATSGTQRYLSANGIHATRINKQLEGRPHIVDAIKNGEIQLVFNTTEGAQALADY